MTNQQPAGATPAETTKRVQLDPVAAEFMREAEYWKQRALINAAEKADLAAKITELTLLLDADDSGKGA